MNQYTFRLDISYHTFQQHYSGTASAVLVRTENGLRIQIPAARLRPYLTQIGVKGRFRLTTDQSNRFIQLESL